MRAMQIVQPGEMRFYTESKVVTTRWFDEVEMKTENVSTWDGTI